MKLHEYTNQRKMCRSIRQGDAISPNFTLPIENIFQKLQGENLGINIDGQKLSNFRYDDNPDDLTEMLQD